MWVQTPDRNTNTKSTVLCTPPSGTVILTETTTDTMCTSGTITDATSGGEKWLKNYIKMHLDKNIHLNILKKLSYVRNIYRIPFSHMKIYIDVSIQISHIVYMLYKTIIIELLTEYHIQCCSESGRDICQRKESMYKGNRWNWRRWYNRYDKHIKKF